MTRAQWAVGLLATASLIGGCDEGGAIGKDLPAPPPTSGRSNVVVATKDAGVAATTVTASARPVAAQDRKLCAGQAAPRPAPKGALKTASAPGATAPAATIPFGAGKWVWLNLWAAWCVPCKEEMPRLIAWQSKLSAAGVLLDLAFISIDDDERQLSRFLEAQPSAGVRASYWLPEGPARGQWFGALGLKETTQLPAHALVAPSGQIVCVIEGAVEDGDYPALAAFLGAKN
jgi:thiol-disulfide isomerase/thioredoxin